MGLIRTPASAYRAAPAKGSRGGERFAGCPRAAARDVFHNEGGFSTLGMVLALLVTLALIFTTAQVQRVESASAGIQNVADAAALAAENPVAEFFIIARVCDAVVLSLSLTAVATLGLGVAALCVPATLPLAEKLLKAAGDVIKTRDSFAKKAAKGLNELQKALPFLCAANAAAVVAANSDEAAGTHYVGFALILPSAGEEIVVGGQEAAQKLSEELETQKEAIAQAAQQAEEEAKKVNAEKLIGFQHDCGNNPNYCLYERAATLVSLPASANPLYRSVDAWNFGVALKRAQAYYPARLAAEVALDDSVEEQARSALRSVFYTYASVQLARGYVQETDTSFKADFPELPANTEQMKQTDLYTEAVYPLTGSGADAMAHAWVGCPAAQGFLGKTSIAAMEAAGFAECPQCHFAASSLGKVAAASTSIENGFEFHYAKVAQAAKAYQKAREAYDPLTQQVKGDIGGLMQSIKEAFSQAVAARIEVEPPGRRGALAFVVNTARQPAQRGFESSFVKSNATLGMQAAVSASVLVGDKAQEGSNIIASALDGIVQKSDNLVVAGLDEVLDLWSALLFAYLEGQQALQEGIKNAVDSIPLASESGLGTWAAAALCDLVETVGLQPVDLDASKPVVVNTAHIAAADDSSLAVRYTEVQQHAVSVAQHTSGDIFSSVIDQMEAGALESLEGFDGEITLASIEFFGEGGPSIPLTIVLPEQIKTTGAALVSSVAQTLRDVVGSVTGVRQWE
ncbi:MAG: molybdenum cofactor biosynthesis enzyme [Raoultibacter sp.]